MNRVINSNKREMIDIVRVLNKLAGESRIFHSEADFQHALAWKIHEDLPDAAIRLEYPVSHSRQQMHFDIRIAQHEAVLAIELKYKTQHLDISVDRETFRLKNHSAQDSGRYDFIKDIRRLEEMLEKEKNGRGYAILLTNDSTYWETPKNKKSTKDAEFRLHEGRTLEGTLDWQGNPAIAACRNAPIVLQGQYRLEWKDYSELPTAGYNKFRYLVVQVGY